MWRFAIYFDIASERNEPPKPKTSASINNPPVRRESIPVKVKITFNTIPNTKTTAKFVITKRTIRFMDTSKAKRR